MSKKKQLTARQFVLDSSKCPACGSENVEWSTITIEVNSTYQEARCSDCGTGFNTVSRLVGYMIDGEDEPQTIAGDFGVVTSTEEPVDNTMTLDGVQQVVKMAVKKVRKEEVKPLLDAMRGMMKAYDQLIPGVANIACSDYAIINDAPIAARKAIAAVEVAQKEKPCRR